ncbi:hypothetical protein ACFSKL_11975 [Belliella marina]|uniref:Uncharacterized protein n=1 Tax=Belliella marina TaxID=1644146 RepID=A0ABW4VLH8_9BACT
MMARIVFKFLPLLLLAVIGVCASAKAQQNGSFNVGGDINKFYPVTWSDGAWNFNKQTELHLGRSAVHTNSQWRGAMIATFNFHANNWGNQAHFIDAHIINSSTGDPSLRGFVAGWLDVSSNNSSKRIIIWLRGGNTTYHFDSNVTVSPIVYDGVQNPLPYVTPNGSASYDIKTEIDQYAKVSGTVLNHPLHVRGGNSAIMGNLGIGTTVPTNKLEVNGTIRAKEVKLEATNWPDYVFEKGYELMPLDAVNSFIGENGHLPGLKPAKVYEEEGVNMLELNQKLLEKVEELTLHTIGQERKLEKMEAEIELLKLLIKEKL